MHGALGDLVVWLQTLPPVALYLALGAAAAIENVFPPLPTDSIVALGAFLAAREQASLGLAFGSIFAGNMLGVSAAYWAGRRLGAGRVRSWIFGPPKAEERTEERLRAMDRRYGMVVLFVARLIPAVRSLCAPLAGALHIPFATSLALMAVASGLWYGLIMFLAYRVSANLDAVVATVARYARDVAIGAVVLSAAGYAVWWLVRRRHRGA